MRTCKYQNINKKFSERVLGARCSSFSSLVIFVINDFRGGFCLYIVNIKNYIYYIADFRPSSTRLMTKMTNDVNDGNLCERQKKKADEIFGGVRRNVYFADGKPNSILNIKNITLLQYIYNFLY